MPSPTSVKKQSLMPSGPLRKALRAAGHHLSPVVQVGKEGVTPAVLAQLDEALLAHELVKVKVGTESPQDRFEAAAQLAAQPETHLAQVLGRTMLVYRKHPERPRFEAGPPAPAAPREPKVLPGPRRPTRPKWLKGAGGPREPREGKGPGGPKGRSAWKGARGPRGPEGMSGPKEPGAWKGPRGPKGPGEWKGPRGPSPERSGRGPEPRGTARRGPPSRPARGR